MRLTLLYFLFYVFVKMNCDVIRIQLYESQPVGNTSKYMMVENFTPLNNYFGIQYESMIVIGSEGYISRVLFSTLSSITWVPSVSCPGERNAYDPSASFTRKLIKSNITINSMSDHLSGNIVSDTIMMGGINIADAVFAEVSEKDGYPTYGIYDGIIGLGYNANNHITPLFSKMVEDKLVEEPVFSLYFGKTSVLLLGGTDSNLHKGPLTYVKVSRSGFWQFNLDKINCRDTTVCADGCQVGVDSSVPFIFGPEDEIEKIYKTIGVNKNIAGDYEIDCDSIPKLPNLEFVVDGHNFNLAGEDYVVQIIGTKERYCRLGIYINTHQLSENDPEWFLGTLFLKKYYSTYNTKREQIGFAERV